MSIRADSVRHSANQGKSTRLQAFVRKYRDCCAAIASREWRMFFEDGKFGGKFANSSKFNGHCGADGAGASCRHADELGFQQAERIPGRCAAVEAGIKHMLHVIN